VIFLPSRRQLLELRARPLPPGIRYQAWGRAEYLARRVTVVGLLLHRWTQDGLGAYDLAAEIDWVLALPGIERNPGNEAAEQLRAAKLVMDAFRELYHLAAFSEFGSASYDLERDVADKIDLILDGPGWRARLQLKMRQGISEVGVRPSAGDRLDVYFPERGCDAEYQPWLPTAEMYVTAWDLLCVADLLGMSEQATT
jgi:hypothetical protein